MRSPLGRHRMVSAFMRGVRRLRPTRPMAVHSWDLSVVLEGLVTAPFEPLESRADTDSKVYSFVGTYVIEKSWRLAGPLCQ